MLDLVLALLDLGKITNQICALNKISVDNVGQFLGKRPNKT
jgi:hypothetical protein